MRSAVFHVGERHACHHPPASNGWHHTEKCFPASIKICSHPRSRTPGQPSDHDRAHQAGTLALHASILSNSSSATGLVV